MNYIDLLFLALIAVSVVFALHKGFLVTLLSMFALALSGLVSFLSYPLLSHFISANESWMTIFVHFTEGSSHITSLELARAPIASLSAQQVATAISDASFPHPFAPYLAQNIEGSVYAEQGLTTLAQYFDRTLVDISINVISFLVLLFVLFFVFTLIITLVNAAKPLPVLRILDWVAASCVGILRGYLMMWALCMLFPLVLVMLPVDFIAEMLQTSALAGPFFPINSLFALVASTA